ncbi:MAG: ABC transporter substrate-binding protein [Endozoicomonas sp.]
MTTVKNNNYEKVAMSRKMIRSLSVVTFTAFLLAACSGPWNNPHLEAPDDLMVYHTNFQLPPRHFDPAVSYSTDESVLIDQIYEPPLGYHFLKRPYELQPATAESLPGIRYLNGNMEEVRFDSGEVAYSEYLIRLKPGIRYQPHPAFARDSNDSYLYLFDSENDSQAFNTITDFPESGTRYLDADDYLYQVKRLADPQNKAPLIGFMSQYIVGMSELTDELRGIERKGWLDLRQFDMKGLKRLDQHTFSITIKGVYPQFSYWLAMHFFAPIPWEADRFYKNPGFDRKNLTLDWYPIGTGPYMMTRNDPNRQIVLERNPNYRDDYYPTEGAPGDREAGLLDDAGKKIPFIDKAIFSLDKEVLPMWTKFLQGYYDRSGENHGNVTQHFDQALNIGPGGVELTEVMQDKNITLSEDVKPALYYMGFNMLDDVVGGYSPERQKLRQAIAIAWHSDEFIEIFRNGAALPFMGPIPPGIAGHLEGEAGINPYTHDWKNGRAIRKDIEYARKLMAEAGYPNGRNIETGEPLKLYLDVQAQATSKSLEDWQKRQLKKLGIELEFRATDWNRYKEKMKTGNHQLFSFGWLADYPDPENFLFLLYGPESPLVCQCDGTNSANYNNPKYNALFKQMKTMLPGPERDELIAGMLDLVRVDAPWFTGEYPKEYYLNNQWVSNTKRHGISKSTLKYLKIDSRLRREKQAEWNQPDLTPLLAGTGLFILLFIPAIRAYRRRQKLVINKE